MCNVIKNGKEIRGVLHDIIAFIEKRDDNGYHEMSFQINWPAAFIGLYTGEYPAGSKGGVYTQLSRTGISELNLKKVRERDPPENFMKLLLEIRLFISPYFMF
jgi:hypothetical protein